MRESARPALGAAPAVQPGRKAAVVRAGREAGLACGARAPPSCRTGQAARLPTRPGYTPRRGTLRVYHNHVKMT